ncbi:MAG: DUF4129 domain-containing protein [Gammaproteobacteria bacterium]|nr:DUF4129 domain-containing protein [Gammaproteobacteria bacterium]
MELDKATVVIRPRNAWEAMDLGFKLIRHWWSSVYAAWFATVFPFFVVLNIVFYDHLWIAGLMFWWLKPLYDRIVLYVIGHALFGATPTLQQTFNKLPGLLKTGLFAHLTLRRGDLARSFNLPVWQLEALGARARRSRRRLLQQRSRSQAVWLTVVCLHLESVLSIGLIGALLLFIPEGHDDALWQQIISGEQTLWYQMFSNVSYFIAVSVMEPMYVGAGFSLYLNRRTHLEAWDIELIFRRMAARLSRPGSSTVTALVVIGLVSITMPVSLALTPAQANTSVPEQQQIAVQRLDPTLAKEVMSSVLEQPEFRTTEEKVQWSLRFLEEGSQPGDPKGIWGLFEITDVVAAVTEILLWVALVVGIVMIVVYRERWVGLFNKQAIKAQDYTAPETLFGMDIRAETLPEDIAGEARRLWNKGQGRDALSLLYRGSLMVLVNRERLQLNSGHTEGDVLALCQTRLSAQRAHYLGRLTGLWQALAYGHLVPEDEQALSLCDQWSQHFGGQE